MKRLFALLLCLLSCCLPALAADIPEPTDDFYVYDGAGVLSYETEGHIVFCNDVLAEACGAQIVFATVDTVGDVSMEDYCIALLNGWNVGDARKQNGFVVVLAIDDDNYGWMPGTGLDLEMSTGTVHALADEYLEPDFASRDYDAGARKFFDVLFERIADICGADVTLAEGDARFQAWVESEDISDSYVDQPRSAGAPRRTGPACFRTVRRLCRGRLCNDDVCLCRLRRRLHCWHFLARHHACPGWRGGGFGYRRYRHYHPPVNPRPPRRPFWGGPRPGSTPPPPPPAPTPRPTPAPRVSPTPKPSRTPPRFPQWRVWRPVWRHAHRRVGQFPAAVAAPAAAVVPAGPAALAVAGEAVALAVAAGAAAVAPAVAAVPVAGKPHCSSIQQHVDGARSHPHAIFMPRGRILPLRARPVQGARRLQGAPPTLLRPYVTGCASVFPRLDGASGRDWGHADAGRLFSGDTSRHVRLQAGRWWLPFAPMPFTTGAALSPTSVAGHTRVLPRLDGASGRDWGARDRMPVFRRTPAGMYGCRLGAGGFPSPQCRSQLARPLSPTSVAGTHTRPPTPGRRFRAGIWGTCRWGACFWGTSKQAARCTITVLALGAGRFPSPQWPAAVSAKGAATYIRLPSPVPALGRTSTCIASRKAAALRPKARGLALLPSPPQR